MKQRVLPPVMPTALTADQAQHTAFQNENGDPLQGCLAWLVHHHRLNHTLTSLLAGLPLVRQRLTPELFVRAASRAGFTAKVVRRSLADVDPATLPAVLLLPDDAGHNARAMVLLRKTPAKANQEATLALLDTFSGAEEVVPESALLARFVGAKAAAKQGARATGVVILVRATLKTMMDQELHSPARAWFWDTLALFKPLYYKVGLAALLINVIGVFTPLFVMNVYDRVVPNAAFETLWVLSAGVMLAYAFDVAFRQLRAYFVDAAGRGADLMLASKLFSHLLDMRQGVQTSSAGGLANQLRDYDTLRDFFTSGTITALVDVPFMLLFLLLVYALAGPVVLLPLVCIPLVLLVCTLVQARMLELNRSVAREQDMKHGLLVETINGLENIKLMGSQSQAQGLYEQLHGLTAKANAKIKFLTNLALNLTYGIGQLAYVGVIIWGVYRIDAGLMTMGALIASGMLMMRAMAPVSQVAGLWVRWTQSKVALESLTKFMSTPLERPAGKTLVHVPRVVGEVVFDKVNFAYPGTKIASLFEVNLTIRPGERVGIIGRAGSGKSSLARLMLGLYEPTQGSIRLDGLELRQLDVAEVRAQVAYCPQNLALFRGSLRDNLLLAHPLATDDDMIRAVELSGAYRLVRRHPLGFDLPVGERGEMLSGGQRQAIGLARAVLRDARLVILDDPTSEMDATSENWVKERLGKWLSGRTLVLITHRPSMLELVDRLVVVDEARIVADGPKDKVLAALGVRAPVQVPQGRKGEEA